MRKSVSVVIPARNEAENLAIVLRDVKKSVGHMQGAEIIVVADGSTDDTAAVAKKSGVKVIFGGPAARGKGTALQKGFDAATGDYVVMLDADCSHKPEDIPAMIDKLDGGAGLVIASRTLGGSEEYTLVRMVGNLLITWLFNALFGTKLTDAINGFKAFRRELVAGKKYSSSGLEIEVEIMARALSEKMRVEEVPSHERARFKGKRKSRTIRDGARLILSVLAEAIKYRLGRG